MIPSISRSLLPHFALCCMAAMLGHSAFAGMTHRWSFNAAAGAAPNGTVFADRIAGAPAVVVGQGATVTGSVSAGALTLPGTTNGQQSATAIAAYLDLPNGIISSKANLTVEIWATPITHRNFQRLLDFGRVNTAGAGGGAPGEITATSAASPGGTEASDSLTLTLSRNTSAGQQRLEAKLNGGDAVIADSDQATTLGTRYHYAFTFQQGAGVFGAAGGQVSWFRDGALIRSIDVAFQLNSLEDVNVWLGRSLWSSDSNTNASYDEVRLYDHAMTLSEISASRTAGPDAAFSPPVAQADAAALNPGQKVRINVVANDTGLVSSGTIQIVQAPQFGTATPDSRGQILYASNAAPGAMDTFSYRVSGPGGTSSPANVTISFTNALKIVNSTVAVPETPPATSLGLVEAFAGLSFASPTTLVSPPDDLQRLFVCEKGGTLKLIPNVTASAPTAVTFLNLSALLTSRGESIRTNSEQGLLGLAFHPSYASNRQFFIFYSVTKGGLAFLRLSRFTTQTANPNAADPASERIFLEQRDESDNHNGGCLAFGPDGYLYISSGDEGDQNDSHANSQRIDRDFFSAVLRIDVDKRAGNLEPNPHVESSNAALSSILRDGTGKAFYSVPADNPFVNATSFNGVALPNGARVRTEFWAVGFRNPWRFSFDPSTGELWCGDVGQNSYEEIDLVTRGGNYGWAYREAAHGGPKTGAPAGFTAIDPIYEYGRTGDTSRTGYSVTGGVVYRGTRVASLTGAYIFADYGSGNIWSLRRNGTNPPTVTRIAGEGGIVAFGADPSNGDVLLADHDNNRILRLTVTTTDSTFPATLTATGLFADLTDLAPNPGLIPYGVNVPFWSDHAIKTRWLTIPNATGRMTWRRDEPWSFPSGMIWVKHFDLELTRNQPATKKRIETRVLVKNASGGYGVSYRWNDAGTEATLVEDSGVTFPLTVTENGVQRTQTWQIPSRANCRTCHNTQAGFALSSNTRQFNHPQTIHTQSGNQLELLRAAGYFTETTPPPSGNTLPRHVRAEETGFTIESRARSYLDVNCAYCHRTGGTAPSAWDGRIETPLDFTGLINGAANNNGGDPANRLIVPGDLTHSVVLNRVAAANGFTRMPPLGTTELDQSGINLLSEWIQSYLPANPTYSQWRTAAFGSPTSPEGDRGFDADGDLDSNLGEYIAGTNPLDPQERFQLGLIVSGGEARLSFAAPAGGSVQIEKSTDLLNWSLWDVPSNQGLAPSVTTLQTISGPIEDARAFYRAKLLER